MRGGDYKYYRVLLANLQKTELVRPSKVRPYVLRADGVAQHAEVRRITRSGAC